MIVLAWILDAKTQDHRIQKGGCVESHVISAKIITHLKVQLVGAGHKGFTGKNRAVITPIIVGDAAAEKAVPVLQPIECPGDPAARATGRSVQYVCGQLSHDPLLAKPS